MDGLRTARVVVLDDTPEDALPLLRALGQLGIGAIYVNGDEQELPDSPFDGIRIAFLDLDLGGTGGESASIIGRLIGVLRRVLADGSHPLGIVTWTKHPELLVDFEKAFRGAFVSLHPVMLANLEKTTDVSSILAGLPARLEGFGAFNFLLFWEQLVSDSAADTTRALSGLVEGDDVKADLMKILGLLGAAGAGPDVDERESALAAMLEALNVVLEDRVMRRSQEAVTDQSGMTAVTRAIVDQIEHRTPAPDEARRARLNGMLLIARVRGAYSPRPGNLYLEEGFTRDMYPIAAQTESRFNLDDLIRHVCKVAADRKDGPKQLADLRECCTPVLLELTPDCDYAQARMQRARLIAGLLIPSDRSKKIRDNEYLKLLKPAYLEPHEGSHVDGQYILVLDALMWAGMSVNELAGQKESFRLRKQVMVDVQAWFGSHAVRPGVVQID